MSEPGIRQGFALLKQPNVNRMFIAYLVSYTGTAMAPIAMAFGVLELTGSTTDASIVIAAPTLASIVILLVGGVVADRTSRQKVIYSADALAMASQFVMAWLFLSGEATVPLLTLFMLINGIAIAFFAPASTGFIIQLVEKKDLQAANALMGTARNGAIAGGAALGGILVATIGAGGWLIKPFTMAALGIFFFEYVFAGLVDPQTAKEYIAGMILLGVAPCTAMVFVWSQLVRGDANYTLVQVSINDIIMVFAFAPLAAFLLGVTDIVVPWETLLLSVVLYVVIPLAAGYMTRRILDGSGNDERISSFTAKVKPFSIMGLLATVVLLFGFQAQTILDKPMVIALIAIPLLIQSYGIFVVAYGWGYVWRVPFSTAAPAALIGTSNFFELAVAVAISLFGLNSGAALATVVGVLVEVPVMLSLVAFANRTRQYFA